MNIKITMHFNRPKHEDKDRFTFALGRAFDELEKAIGNHCITSKQYARGSGSVLDNEGVLVGTYEVTN